MPRQLLDEARIHPAIRARIAAHHAPRDAMRNFLNSHWKVILAILLAIVLALNAGAYLLREWTVARHG